MTTQKIPTKTSVPKPSALQLLLLRQLSADELKKIAGGVNGGVKGSAKENSGY